MKQLWLGRRFQLNEQGLYAAWGKSQGDALALRSTRPSLIRWLAIQKRFF